MFIQAMVINLAPLLFIPFREQFGLSYEQMGRLVLVNFLTQMVVDLLCCAAANRIAVKPLVVGANLLAGVGLWIFALSPGWFAEPYTGLVLGTVVLSVGCGLLEVLLSPIINAVPSASGHKDSDMALLHAFYPIGKVTVILVTALALFSLGTTNWRGIVLAWSVFPFLNTLGFLLVQPPPLVEEGQHQTFRDLFRQRAFLQLLLVIGLAGATELTIAQWASAFLEKGLGWSKLTADLVGFCLFAVGMILGRLWIGLKGESVDLRRVMLSSSLLSAAMCVVLTLAPYPWLALAACGPAGVFVSMLWPGSLSLSAARFPRGGAAMFALLAAAGDGGAAIMPWMVGIMADDAHRLRWLEPLFGANLTSEQFGLRAGLLVTAICPILLSVTLSRFRKR
jgi:fucose permease